MTTRPLRILCAALTAGKGIWWRPAARGFGALAIPAPQWVPSC